MHVSTLHPHPTSLPHTLCNGNASRMITVEFGLDVTAATLLNLPVVDHVRSTHQVISTNRS